VRVRLPGNADEATLVVTLTGGRHGTLEQNVAVSLVPPPDSIPEGEFESQSLWEAEETSHQNGHEVEDEAAFNGKAWAAVEGTDRLTGTTIWGQYELLQPGSYAVAFRCRTSSTGEGLVATIDAFNYDPANEAESGVLAARAVRASDLPADGAYADLWLRFELRREAKVEYRVRWSGKHDVVADRIVVLRAR